MNCEITVKGLVQGVGFRPYVYRLATNLKYSGDVRNSGGIVRIRLKNVTGEEAESFVSKLKADKPKGSVIESAEIAPVDDIPDTEGFIIVASDTYEQEEFPDIPADIGICSRCLAEMKDLNNRRYGYPYISCVSCGPRFSIIEKLPYDRENTSMEEFGMCSRCREDYEDSVNPYARRHFAQTNSCNDCGPQPILKTPEGDMKGNFAVKKACEILQNGGILALKGVGGYQFVCDPEDTYAVLKLREIKGREKKPFAILFPTVACIKRYAVVTEAEEKLLRSDARPIVLLEANGRERFSRFVCADSRSIGAMLPHTGIHEILASVCGPLIVTSGNISGEPLSYKDDEFFRHEYDGLEGTLYNKRKIMTPLDDSVMRIMGGRIHTIRYARGLIPGRLELAYRFKKNLLSMGGDLKSAFAISKGRGVVLSQYTGDLESYAVQETYKTSLKRYMELYDFRPEAIACDKHPGYISGRIAKELSDKYHVPVIGIYHHHAHVASVMAEHGLTHAIGVAMDGTGYGKDGKIWGSEIFYISRSSVERKSHLDYFTLIGGDEAAKDAGKDLKCLMHAADMEIDNPLIAAAIDEHINTFETSSAGRLFDIMAAALGLRSYNTYESECATALENAAYDALRKGMTTYAMPVTSDPVEMLYYAMKAKDKGADVREIALGFHRSLSSWVIKECVAVRDEKADNNVCLSGGCFANRVLNDMCRIGLGTNGFQVYMNEKIPGNDQGIAVGQAYILSMQ
ncbi:MAG: carbamoyltransferase HypF [Lachnospiraceae bacterium]|nr:carbamoyltransferase HypF [Lachnospiraceae bacterium]